MKKIAFAACLMLATNSAFSQTQQTGNGNNSNGQNDCQCTGTGIPVSNQSTPIKQTKDLTQTLSRPGKESMIPGSIWYAYLKMYFLEKNIISSNSNRNRN
jgi:hypothetical protein